MTHPQNQIPPRPADPATATDAPASPPVRRAKLLRRWSVAELIARAVILGPPDRASHT
jgi:hypothetical protein